MAPVVDVERALDACCDRLERKLYPIEQAGEGSKRWKKNEQIRALIERG